ncbi:MAG: acyl-CoA dehydrogenase, partial [Deltaproteobacteria bacterium]|nr:acyl-CoA dehydrogenase [Deltaproteobacteria bacterium]
AAVVYEELGRGLVPSPHFVSCVLSARALLHGGSEARRSEWLPKIASGEAILAPVWLEPRRGYGAKGVQLRAEPEGDEVVLSGTKLHAVFASAANRWIVLARSGEDEEAVDLFLVDPATPGITLSQRINLGSETTYRVDFDGVRVPVSQRIGSQGSGWSTWSRVMHEGIVLAAAQAAGGAKQALEMTVEYAKERQQFNKPIGAFQSISHYLADAATAIEGGSTLVYEAAWAHAQGRDVSTLAPLAKHFMCRAFRDTTATAQQVWGGVGFTIEYDIQLYFRRAKQLQLSWWDESQLADLAATQILGG